MCTLERIIFDVPMNSVASLFSDLESKDAERCSEGLGGLGQTQESQDDCEFLSTEDRIKHTNGRTDRSRNAFVLSVCKSCFT